MSNELPVCETLLLSRDGGRLHLTLNRPQARNAINERMSDELNAVFDAIRDDRSIRALVLRGAEGNFCSGGDIKERRASVDDTVVADTDPLAERNARGGRMLNKLNSLPQVTVAVIEGAAMGGGLGMACCVDVAIVERNARFAMPETTLGVAPAQIAPFVVRRIGLTQARRLALTGQRIDGAEAVQLGIAHELCDGAGELDARLERVLQAVERSGPNAIAVTKEIMLAVGTLPEDEMIAFSAKKFAALNRSEEGKEGQTAFIEKRSPTWVPAAD